MNNQIKDKRNFPTFFPKIEILQNCINSVYQPSLRFTYLEYLKQQYAKQIDQIQPNLLANQELVILPKRYFWQTVKTSNDVGESQEKNETMSVESSKEESSKNQTNKRNIFKKLFRIKPKVHVSTEEDVDGFVWVEDPLQAKKNSLKWKLRKYFLLNPDLNEVKRQDDEDDMLNDFVVIEPEKLKEPQKSRKFQESLIDFTAGSLAGIAQVYVAQPLDTVKVKLQTYPKLYSNMFKCFLHTYRQSGVFRGLYAGTLPAVVASVAENSVLFTAYSGCQKLLAVILEIDHVCELSVLGNACAGFLSAFFTTFTLCPTELVKCRLQVVQEMKAYVAKDSKAAPITAFKLTKDILKKEGISGFYRGLGPTFVREMPGVFFFFGSYEATREFLKKPGQSKENIGPLKTMTAGAVGGVALWTITFPADVIKSRIQINNLNESMFSVGLNILRKEGVSTFYNGLMPSILRTIPSTATLFLVYEYTKKVLNKIPTACERNK